MRNRPMNVAAVSPISREPVVIPAGRDRIAPIAPGWPFDRPALFWKACPGLYSARSAGGSGGRAWMKVVKGGVVKVQHGVNNRIGHHLLRLGVILFLLGLLTGFAVPMFVNPRMGLSSHLEGVINGIFLIALGLIWPKLRLGRGLQVAAFVLAVYGAFVNWGTTLLAGVWGAGETMMPLAGEGHEGTSGQELLISFGLLSLSLAMIVVSVIVLYGLRGKPIAEPAG